MARVKFGTGVRSSKNDALLTIVIKGFQMTTHKTVFALASAALLVAAPAMGQVLNHPVMVLPQGADDGATFFGVQYGKGLNDDSGKYNSFLLAGGRAMERVSFALNGSVFTCAIVPGL